MSAQKSTVLLVAAYNSAGYIGKNGKLMYHIREDLKRFKMLTAGRILVMGRKTFESLPRCLPGRPHYVITTRRPSAINLPSMTEDDEVQYFDSFDTAMKFAHQEAETDPACSGIAIIGGESVFLEGLLVADRLELTEIKDWAEGDARFPGSEDFNRICRERGAKVIATSSGTEDGLEYRFYTYQFPVGTTVEAHIAQPVGINLVRIKGKTLRLGSIDLVEKANDRALRLIVAGHKMVLRFDSEGERNMAHDSLMGKLSAES